MLSPFQPDGHQEIYDQSLPQKSSWVCDETQQEQTELMKRFFACLAAWRENAIYRISGFEFIMNNPAASSEVSKNFIIVFPKVVTPKCSYRGSSPRFAWIPAKSMRE
jgi:hypothetical protein